MPATTIARTWYQPNGALSISARARRRPKERRGQAPRLNGYRSVAETYARWGPQCGRSHCESCGRQRCRLLSCRPFQRRSSRDTASRKIMDRSRRRKSSVGSPWLLFMYARWLLHPHLREKVTAAGVSSAKRRVKKLQMGTSRSPASELLAVYSS